MSAQSGRRPLTLFYDGDMGDDEDDDDDTDSDLHSCSCGHQHDNADDDTDDERTNEMEDDTDDERTTEMEDGNGSAHGSGRETPPPTNRLCNEGKSPLRMTDGFKIVTSPGGSLRTPGGSNTDVHEQKPVKGGPDTGRRVQYLTKCGDQPVKSNVSKERKELNNRRQKLRKRGEGSDKVDEKERKKNRKESSRKSSKKYDDRKRKKGGDKKAKNDEEEREKKVGE